MPCVAVICCVLLCSVMCVAVLLSTGSDVLCCEVFHVDAELREYAGFVFRGVVLRVVSVWFACCL